MMSWTALSWAVTTEMVELASRCSRVSPQQRLLRCVSCYVRFASPFAKFVDGVHSHNADPAIQAGLGLARNEVVLLPKDLPALRVAEQRPCDAAVFELGNGDLAGESTVGLVEHVLRGDFDGRGEVFAREEQVERGWGDYHFRVGIWGC